MTSEPAISVILPCYNAHRHLPQVLGSLKSQTFDDLEVIIVDDGSTDPETVSFLVSVSKDVRLLRQENRGLPAARNAGINAARGEFVLPLDCDDWLEPNALARLYEAITASAIPGFAYAQLQMEGDGSGVLVKRFNFFEQLFLNQLPYCILLRKSDWRTVGGYDESMRRGYEDWEFNIRLGAAGLHGIAVPEPLFHYRISQSGMLMSISRHLHAELWEGIRRKHVALYRPASLLRLWRQWRGLPSSYPLWAYFPWLIAANILPNRLFSRMYGVLRRRFSRGHRITQQACRAAD